MQRVEPDKICAQRAGKPDHFDQILEVADAPVASGPQLVELQTDAPHALFREQPADTILESAFWACCFPALAGAALSTSTPSAARTFRFVASVIGTSTLSGAWPCRADPMLLARRSRCESM
jgi:hypothetical protein